ncbi:MAG: serine/threonine protein kinase [Nannocystis sp.]|uniref:serine/threonine-protein kinase n=1 Tax=Nannocystis sp. TaxID=1962667 RepID=UPI002422CD5B|nr:serine/threonine-protein kinase [Nannocystis sp.]MBK9753443.1 serine/threonine protein kinase [Nannocystis sp.]
MALTPLTPSFTPGPQYTDDLLAWEGVAADLPRDSTGRELARAAYARLFGEAGEAGLDAGEDPTVVERKIGDERQARGSEASPELARGTLVGRYLLLARIGAGGMGVVYAAHDPELDRKVALKLLLPERADSLGSGPARLLREAQALAKLSHPNVVTVHDAGVHDGRVWIAMEFVSGQTLREWTRRGRRTWPEVLRVLTDVARGVVAAHAVGLIHRDLKPDNVMIGSDGRVRVMDFGLARYHSLATADQELASTAELDDPDERRRLPTLAHHAEFAAVTGRLTRPGAIQGTPAYMGPEQWRGQEAEAATDPFGWSVMGWEALYGERPYAGASVTGLATAVLLGRRRPVPGGRRVPAWLRRILERGLGDEPAQRWPTMQDLLSALERGKAHARTRLAMLVLTGFAVVGLLAGAHRWWDRSQRVLACESTGAAAVDGIWGPVAREQLRAAFSATGLSYAATTAEKVIPWLDEQALAWKRERTEACLRADVDGNWDRDTVDRAVWCLEERQLELRALVEEFGQPNARTVQEAVAAATNLRAPAECTDADLLARQPAPPPYDHEALAAVRAQLSRAHILGLSGNYKDALAMATAARSVRRSSPPGRSYGPRRGLSRVPCSRTSASTPRPKRRVMRPTSRRSGCRRGTSPCRPPRP